MSDKKNFLTSVVYHHIPLVGSLVVGSLLLAVSVVAGSAPNVLDSIRPSYLRSSADVNASRLVVLVDGASSTIASIGGGYTLSAINGGQPFAAKQLDARYSICSLINQNQCSPAVVGPWGSYQLDTAGSVRVALSDGIPVGVYVAQFKPRGESNWQWSEPVRVVVNPAGATAGQKAAFHKFTNLRAGMLRTSDGKWNVQDYALHLVNPSNQNIDVFWKFVADDPNFLFTDGSKGVKNRVLPIDAGGFQSLNIAGPEIYPFEIPTYSNFTGSNELLGCVRGSNPCVPAKFYAYFLAQTPVKVGLDANDTWFKSWDEWRDTTPVGWDQDLGVFIVPYTNYWHNVADWPKGWYSKLSLSNNGSTSAVYTVKHVPDAYSQRVTQASGCGYQPYTVQTVNVTVAPKATKTVDLQTLFGWSPTTASYAEGYLMVTPPSGTASNTVVTSEVLPGATGSALCPSHNSWFATVAIKSPVVASALSGTSTLSAHIVQNRGTGISKVGFYLDGQPVGEGTVSPQIAFDSTLSFDANSFAPGSHQLTAKIFRAGAELATSTPVAITLQSNSVTYNGNDSAIQFSGNGWTNFSPLAGAYKEDEIYTGSTGAMAKLTTVATRIKVYGAKAYNRGKMAVSIDGGQPTIVDPYSASTQTGALLFDSGPLSSSMHTVEVKNVSTDRAKPFIGIDKIVVIKP